MIVLFLFFLFLFNCDSSTDNSFSSLSESFIRWYDKNHPVQSTMKNIQRYNDSYKQNDYKDRERYVLDLNRFYFELSQINSKKLNTINQLEYSRLEKIMTKLIYIEENVRPSEWMPSIKLRELQNGLKSLIDYDYLSMKNKMDFINKRLKEISKILNNTLISLVFLSEEEYDKCSLIIDSINKCLDSIEVNIDFNENSFDNIISEVDKLKKDLKDYKNQLKSIKKELKNINYKASFNIDDDFYSIMSESDVSINELNQSSLIDLKSEQVRLFHSCLPIYLMHNDEPIWIDYQDTLNVVDYVMETINYDYKLDNFKYMESLNDNREQGPYVEYSFYNNITDLNFLNEDTQFLLPLNKQVLQFNLPRLDIHFLLEKEFKNIFFNSIQFDLLDANYIYPGMVYSFYKNTASDVIYNFPSEITLKGLRRYAERVFVKTNQSATINHQIIHKKNILKDICKCYIDIEYNKKQSSISELKEFLRNNCFLDELEINREIEALKNEYFGHLSQAYIGFNSIIDLEKEYFRYEDSYLEFYNKLLKYGIVDLENLHLLLENH